MFDKGQSLWDSRQNFEKNKGQDLALSHNVRDIFSRSTGAGKIVVPRFGRAKELDSQTLQRLRLYVVKMT